MTNKDKEFRTALREAGFSSAPAFLTNITQDKLVRRAFSLESHLRRMPGFGYRKRIKGPVRAWTTDIIIPNWIIEDREVNLSRLIGREMLRRLNCFRVKCSTTRRVAVFTVESESLFISVDKFSHVYASKNAICFKIRLFLQAEHGGPYFTQETFPVKGCHTTTVKKMNRKEIVEKVIGCIVKVTGENDIQPDNEELHLTNDLEIDSLDQVEITMEVEQAFGIRIEDYESRGFNTVADIVNLVERKLEERK